MAITYVCLNLTCSSRSESLSSWDSFESSKNKPSDLMSMRHFVRISLVLLIQKGHSHGPGHHHPSISCMFPSESWCPFDLPSRTAGQLLVCTCERQSRIWHEAIIPSRTRMGKRCPPPDLESRAVRFFLIIPFTRYLIHQQRTKHNSEIDFERNYLHDARIAPGRWSKQPETWHLSIGFGSTRGSSGLVDVVQSHSFPKKKLVFRSLICELLSLIAHNFFDGKCYKWAADRMTLATISIMHSLRSRSP
jgi:hypothetical protein